MNTRIAPSSSWYPGEEMTTPIVGSSRTSVAPRSGYSKRMSLMESEARVVTWIQRRLSDR